MTTHSEFCKKAVAFTTPSGGLMVCGDAQGFTSQQLAEKFAGIVHINEHGWEEENSPGELSDFIEKYKCFV